MSSQINEIMNMMGRIDNAFGKYMLLVESQETKSINYAVRLVMQELGYDKKDADEFVRNDVRSQFPSLREKVTAKFILGVTRMLLNGDFDNDDSLKDKFDTALKYASTENYIDKFDRNFNNLSAQEIVNMFSEQIQKDLENDKNDVNTDDYTRNENYDIIRINDFDDAEQYSSYTTWCVTRDISMFNQYTNYGIGQFYFCLRKGFENEDPEVGNEYPYDSFGLSMIAVCVDENGRLKTCTSRWNSQDEPDGHLMTSKQLSELLGVNFYSVFKPNNEWRNILDDIQKRLANGQNPVRIFDEIDDTNPEILCVKLSGKWNFLLKNGTFLSKRWFEGVEPFVNGYALVTLNDKQNFIDRNGRYVFREFVDYISGEECGIRRINNNDKDGYIDKNFKFITNQWFDYGYDFSCGFAAVSNKINSHKCEYNYINTKGELLFDEWLEDANNFIGGLAKISRNGKENLIDTNGKSIIEYDVDAVGSIYCNKMTWVKSNGGYNFIDRNGNFLSKTWFQAMGSFEDGLCPVKLNGKWNFIDNNFEIVFKQWFDIAWTFSEGFAGIKLNDKWNFIGTDGKYLCPNQWFDAIDDDFDDGVAYVTIDDHLCGVRQDGSIYDAE